MARSLRLWIPALSCAQVGMTTALLPRDIRLALLHEGGAAFDVILAGEATGNEVGRAGKVALALGLQHLRRDLLDGADRQGRVGGDVSSIVLDEGPQLAVRKHAADDAHLERLVGA